MSSVEVLNQLKKIMDKLETKGVRIWGVDAGGTPRTVLVTEDGKLVWTS